MDIIIPEGWVVLPETTNYAFSEVRSFSAELVPEAIRNIAQPGLTYRNPETGTLLQKQKSGKWKKIGTERSPLEILKGGGGGRVPKHNPAEPLSSGSTPLEKIKQKLTLLNKNISDTDKLSTDKELGRYGRLKLAADEIENTKEERFKLPFGKRTTDLDSSKARKKGKIIRKILPDIKDRQNLSKAIFLGRQSLISPDPILRKRNADTREVLHLENKKQELDALTATMMDFLSRKEVKNNFFISSSIKDNLDLLKKYQKRYASALVRSSSIRV